MNDEFKTGPEPWQQEYWYEDLDTSTAEFRAKLKEYIDNVKYNAIHAYKVQEFFKKKAQFPDTPWSELDKVFDIP